MRIARSKALHVMALPGKVLYVLVILSLLGPVTPITARKLARASSMAQVSQDKLAAGETLEAAVSANGSDALVGEVKPRFSISWTATATGHYEHTGGFGSSQVIDKQARMAGFGIWQEEEGMPSNSYLIDLEDGSMGDSALHWSLDIDGALGTGRLRQVLLSHGTHTITLTVQDSGGLTATNSISVTALSPGDWRPNRVYLPIIQRP